MKRSYSLKDVERWRDRVYGRTLKSSVKNEHQALHFINGVGFCLAVGSAGLELPNLWDAIMRGQPTSENGSSNGFAKRSYYLSYAWEIQNVLPNHNSIYYGKIFRRRPSLVSREYFPYFYALTERTGTKDEHTKAYAQGKLSLLAKNIMDTLMKSAPLSARHLRNAVVQGGKRRIEGFEKALEELQRKMFIGRVVGNGNHFGAEWAPVVKCFPVEVRKAKTISADHARYKLLEKYFQNQLMTSVEAIHRVFGWTRPTIYHVIGQLVHAGIITTTVALEEKPGQYYCLVH
jgi:hypothetical protein